MASVVACSQSMALEESVNLFLESRKNANKLVDIINIPLDSGDFDVVMWISSLEKIFLVVSDRGDFLKDDTLHATDKKAGAAEEKYVQWLTQMFETTWMKIFELLNSEKPDVQSSALNALMNLIAQSTRHIYQKFPLEKLFKVVEKILALDQSLLALYLSFKDYKDVQFYTWKVLFELCKNRQHHDSVTLNTLELVQNFGIPKEGNNLYFYSDLDSFKYKEELVNKWVQKVWLSLTNRKLSQENHKKLLIILLEGYLSKLRKPTLLTDFLVSSLSLGGAVALLALQGMSTLVTKHNLECPNIFGRLYNMFTPEMLHGNFKARLFYLADLFMQSTYISEQLVAAFAKRLSRLSLIAQAPDLVLIMQFVGNLLIRHPALMVLVHSSNTDPVDSDPFVMDEPDPIKSRAMESSLWELAMLKNHVQPKVAAAAKFLDTSMPSIEWNFKEQLESSYSQLFESEIKKNAKIQPALTFVRPVTIAQLREDRVYKMWSLD